MSNGPMFEDDDEFYSFYQELLRKLVGNPEFYNDAVKAFMEKDLKGLKEIYDSIPEQTSDVQ